MTRPGAAPVAFVLLALLGLSALGTIGCRSDAPSTHSGPGATLGSANAGAKTDPLRGIPHALLAPTDDVNGAVRLAVQGLANDEAAVTAAVATAVTARRILPRDILGDAPGAPRAAGELAAGVPRGAQHVGRAGSYELAHLAGAMLKARGFEDIHYGQLVASKFGASELLARRYFVRVGDGPWLSPEPSPAGATASTGTTTGTTNGDNSAIPPGVVALDRVSAAANLLAWRALGAMRAGEGEGALTAARHARRLQPQDGAIAFVLARAMMLDGQLGGAIDMMEVASKKSSDALTWYLLARAYELDQRPFNADRALRQAITADPGFVEPHLMLAQLALDRLEVTPSAEHAAVIASAAEHVARAQVIDVAAPGLRVIKAHLAALDERFEDALSLLKEETQINPDFDEGWLVLAQFQTVSGQDAQALDTLAQAIAAGAGSPDIVKAQALLLASAGRFDEALPALESALALSPDDPELRPQLAQLMREKGRLPAARRLLEAHLKRWPDDLTVSLLQAQLEIDDGQIEKGHRMIQEVLKVAPDNAEARVLDYLASVAKGQDDEVARQRAIKTLGGRRPLAQLLLQHGLLEQAETTLKEGLGEEADDVVLPILLVGLYYGTERPAEGDAIRAATLLRFDEQDHQQLNDLFDEAIRQATATARPSPDQPPPSTEKQREEHLEVQPAEHLKGGGSAP